MRFCSVLYLSDVLVSKFLSPGVEGVEGLCRGSVEGLTSVEGLSRVCRGSVEGWVSRVSSLRTALKEV